MSISTCCAELGVAVITVSCFVCSLWVRVQNAICQSDTNLEYEGSDQSLRIRHNKLVIHFQLLWYSMKLVVWVKIEESVTFHCDFRILYCQIFLQEEIFAVKKKKTKNFRIFAELIFVVDQNRWVSWKLVFADDQKSRNWKEIFWKNVSWF